MVLTHLVLKCIFTVLRFYLYLIYLLKFLKIHDWESEQFLEKVIIFFLETNLIKMNYNKALDNGSGGPDEISDQQIKSLVQKFQRKGFDGLALEEVATALIIPNFGKVFQ